MPDFTRPRKFIQYSRDCVCRSCGKDRKAGEYGYWAPPGITWCATCSVPAEVDEPYEDTRSFDSWADKKIAEDAERLAARQALQEMAKGEAGLVSASTPDGGHDGRFDLNTSGTGQAPASITSDARFAEEF